MFKIKGGWLWPDREDGRLELSAREALEWSIAKWRFILGHLRETGELVRDGGRMTCALCWVFQEGAERCQECPVGRVGCAGTPYWQYIEAVAVGNLARAIEAAEAEVKFLEGLREAVKDGTN